MSTWKSPRDGRRGVALVVTVVVLAIVSSIVAEFSYRSTVDLASAVAARDELRAHYLAKGGIDLARLLVKVQQAVFDKNRQLIGDIQLTQFAPYLATAFGSGGGGREVIAGLLGLPEDAAASLKGVGLPGGSFDLEIASEDGRINLNCAGGALPTPAAQAQVAQLLTTLFAPVRYNVLFEEPNADGQLTSRAEQVRAIIDYIDGDTALYEGGSAPEDYGYQSQRDPYQPRNNRFDTLDELRMVRGVDDDFMAAFGDSLGVWGDCKIQLGGASPALIASLLRAAAKRPEDLRDERNLLRLADAVVESREFMGGVVDLQSFINIAKRPLVSFTSSTNSSGTPIVGIELDPKRLEELATIGPRRIYRIEAVGQSGKVHKRIRAVFDTQKFNQNAVDPLAERQGAWIYWREE
jgi:general secretion pathway protein K